VWEQDAAMNKWIADKVDDEVKRVQSLGSRALPFKVNNTMTVTLDDGSISNRIVSHLSGEKLWFSLPWFLIMRLTFLLPFSTCSGSGHSL
jgi:hypothetical protein